MNTIEIYIFGVKVMEPIVTLTDIITAVFCFVLYSKLDRISDEIPFKKQVRIYFLTMGIATFIGGVVGHAFLYKFGFSAKLFGWVLSCFGMLFLQLYSINCLQAFTGQKKRLFKIASVILFLAVLVLLMNPKTMDFRVIQIYTSISFFMVVIPVHLFLRLKFNSIGCGKILLSIGIGMLTALIFNFEIGFHAWFNHIAFAHIIMVLFFLTMYKGLLIQEFELIFNLENERRNYFPA